MYFLSENRESQPLFRFPFLVFLILFCSQIYRNETRLWISHHAINETGMEYNKVAIIGSNGFIGVHLTNILLQSPGIQLFLFGKSDVSAFGDTVPYTKIDLTNSLQINTCFADIDLVYYLASETIPSTSWDNPLIEIEKNLLPFLNFMEQIVKHKVKKVVFISSAGTIYGPTHLSVTETSYTNPFSPYGINKLTMEHYLNYYKVRHNLAYDIYRVSNIYGDGQNTKKGIGIINTFLENILTANKVQIFGNGEHIRNYIYIKDLAVLLSINDLVKIIKGVVKEEFEVTYTPTRQSDNPAIYLDNSKMLNAYPDLKLTPIAEGIEKTYEFIKKSFGNQAITSRA